MEGGSYDCVCCKNKLTVVIAGAEICAFGELTICRYEGTKTEVPIFCRSEWEVQMCCCK